MWPFRPVLALHFPASSGARKLFQDIDKQLHYVNNLAVEVVQLSAPSHLRSEEYVTSLVKSYAQMVEGLLPRINKYHKKEKINIFEPVEQERLDELANQICTTYNINANELMPTIRAAGPVRDEFTQWYHLTQQAKWIQELQTLFDPTAPELVKAIGMMPDEGLPQSFYRHYHTFLTSINDLADRCGKYLLPWIDEDYHTVMKCTTWLDKHSIAKKM